MTATTLAAPSITDRPRTRIDWLAAIAFGLVWLELIARLRFEWSINPQYGYGWTVPFLAAFIFWRRLQRAPLPEKPAMRWLPMALIILAALAFVPARLIQEANPDWRLLSWAMALATVAISGSGIYLAGGAPWLRQFAFPLLFFLVAVPWPTQFEQLIVQGLMHLVAGINVEVLNLIGVSAVQVGNVIEVATGYIGIADACTGVRSLQATFMVSLFLGEFYRFTVARRVLLIIGGAVLAFACNLVRTFFLVWVGAERGVDSIEKWHDPAGLTILMACLFGLWGLSMLMGGSRDLAETKTAARGFRLPRALLVALLGLTISAEAATQFWYGYHEVRSARVEPWSIAWPTSAQSWKPVPIAEQAQELLRYNEGGGGSWIGDEGHPWLMYFFKWLPGRTAGLFIKNHRPDICLPASGMTLRGGVRNQLIAINGITLPVRAYVFANGSSLLYVYYCYWDGSAPETIASDRENWTATGRLEAVRRGKREIGTQMLEIVGSGFADESAADAGVRAQLRKIIQPK